MNTVSPTRSSRRWLAWPLAALLVVGGAGDALAKGKKKSKKKGKKGAAQKVELTGIPSVDKVFKQLKKLDGTVTSANKHRTKTHKNINTALGLKNASLGQALNHIQSKAKGKVRVTVQGRVPQLQASDALPPDIIAGIEAINDGLKHYSKSLVEVSKIPKQAKNLSKKIKAAPDEIKKEFLSNPTLAFKVPKGIKATKNNLGIAKSLPKRSKTVVKGINADTKLIVTTFGGKWPPI